MKKLVTLLLAIVLVFSMVSCSSEGASTVEATTPELESSVSNATETNGGQTKPYWNYYATQSSQRYSRRC